MRFSELFESAGVTPAAISGDAEIGVLSADSRTVLPGEVFVAMPSGRTDAHEFIAEAQAKGAAAAIVYDPKVFAMYKGAFPVALIPAEAHAEALWRLSKAAFGDPSRGIRIMGVTGTNGKTTVAKAMTDALNAIGSRSAYLGTLGYDLPQGHVALHNTTPFVVDVNRYLAMAHDHGVEALVMEVSSHALDQRRVDGVKFDGAIFTNLSQDHLDYHESMEVYAGAKFRLFTDLPRQSAGLPFVAIINVDDPVGAQWANLIDHPVLSFGFNGGDFRGAILEMNLDGTRLRVEHAGEFAELECKLIGRFNAENMLAVAAGLRGMGYSLEEIKQGLAAVEPVRGRFELVRNSKGIAILVDYAHTPDALAKLLASARQLNPQRIITVFGCGGDRDATKRPLMATQAAQGSNVVIATSDNPRTEDPEKILDDVVAGFAAGTQFQRIVDRPAAIAEAVKMAMPGDLVVIAGKGHEDYQIIGHTKYPMDDRELALRALGEA
jgi:UDP-N-acetylmuramoyl-L-alanyl-D-glutamate--2,6-diaminopimelate ligase